VFEIPLLAGLLRVLVPARVSPALAGPRPFRYPPARHGGGRLRYRNQVPVLTVGGTPEEIGEQTARLAVRPARGWLRCPEAFLKYMGRPEDALDLWPEMVRHSVALAERFPSHHARELSALVRAGMALVPPDEAADVGEQLLLANTLLDWKNAIPGVRNALGCSALAVDAARSTTGGPLLGRNRDFPSLGLLDPYGLVTVCRPEGKHSFASVGYPGVVGCLSGMNEAGLVVAALEVYGRRRRATDFDADGVPYPSATACCWRAAARWTRRRVCSAGCAG